VGKDVAHNNMPPYLVLNVCKKLPEGYVSTPNGTVKVDVTEPATSSINLANDDKGYGLTGVIISALSLFISAILAIDKLVNRRR
jgi:stringent starvation protein B